jgi:5,10-methenyltetrahydromethanopterin hydrogenase
MYCQSPGCHDYAKWGKYINDLFCPACQRAITQSTVDAAKALGGIAVTVATTIVTTKAAKIFEEKAETKEVTCKSVL